MKKILITLILGLMIPVNGIFAQTEDTYSPVDFSLQLKNMHLWRGIQVSNSALTAVDFSYRTKDGSFGMGLWGGASFDGKFREFDYYISYTNSGFTIALWDIYNFSPGATYNNSEVFNYKSRETGHFIDLSIAYRFQGSFPLGLGWATIIHGRDRGGENKKQLYSTYVHADYPVLRGKFVDLDFGLAGAFALSPEKETNAHFYGKDPGIVSITVGAAKRVQLGNFVLPVSVLAMWNPVSNEANLQIALDIF